MASEMLVLECLVRSAVGGLLFLIAAAVAVRLCKQPVDRVRVTEFALLGALLVPVLALLPGIAQWSVGLLPADASAVVSQTPQTQAEELTTTKPEGSESYRPNPFASLPVTNTDTRSQSESASLSIAPPEQATPALRLPEPAQTAASPASTQPIPWRMFLLLAYGCATALMLAWTLLGFLQLFLLRRHARPAPLEALTFLREIAGPRSNRVRLLMSDAITSPIAFRGLRPVIVIPVTACTSPDRAALKFCLAHEWSHIERGDLRRWYVAALAQVMLFYQPLYWWLRRQLRLSQDFLADARAAEQADPIDYAEFLVGLAKRQIGMPALALGISDNRSHLTRRVHMLLLNREPLSRRCRSGWTAAASVVAFALLGVAATVRFAAGDPPPVEKPAAAPEKEAKKPAEEKAETLNYSGKVVDKISGKPLAGATVTVRRSVLGDPDRTEQNPIIEETEHKTNAAGEYSFTIPPEQTKERYLYIELDVAHPDYGAQKGFGYALSMIRKNEKLGGRPFFEKVELRPAQPATGVVRTPDGKPAAGVKVMSYSVTAHNRSQNFEYGSFDDTRTDAEGKFRLPLVTPGWGVIWILPEDYSPSTHVVKDKRGDCGVFTLQPGIRLRGKVLDAKGNPVAGVNVNAVSRDHNEEITEPVSDQIERTGLTNEKGEFEMKPLPPGNYLVKPDDYPRDAVLDRKDAKTRPVAGVYSGTKVTLKAGTEPEPVEVRAVPHVVIEAQYVDANGKPTRGHEAFVYGEIDGGHWNGMAKPTPDGKLVALVPHGLEKVQLQIMTNEHGALRWRKSKDDTLHNDHQIQLGTVNDDVKGIEIIHYKAPILVVKVTVKDGSKPQKMVVTAEYGAGKSRMPGGFSLVGRRRTDVSFEEQEDGRFRSEQMLPDEQATVTAYAEGYESKPQTVKLAEASTKEIELVLEKAEAKKEGEKK